MEFEKRAMTQEEDKYSFRQSSQISMQCGLIGHLRADMDTDGNGFFSSWDDYRRDLKTTEFKEEFDEVINSLREEGDILHNRSALAKYCFSHPQSKMSTEQDYYGVRVDTAQYSYLLRLNPNKGEYNLYCYCYRRDWLSRHIEQARRGIRFIDPHYKELFRIPDGDKIRVTFPDGETKDQICRYIDDYHVEMGVGDNLYHICEFAERMESIGAKVIPLRSSLPEQCYSMLLDTGEIIILKKGESGYYRTDFPAGSKEENRALVNEYNEKLGVTKAQEAAMSVGTMFGFACPGADPKKYDIDGNAVSPKQKERGEAR